MDYSRTKKMLTYQILESPSANLAFNNTTESLKLAKISREELRNVFKEEIDGIVEKEVNFYKNRIELEVKEKFNKDIEQLNAARLTNEKLFNDKVGLLENLIHSFSQDARAALSVEISSLEEIIILITMESLYKILGQSESYREAVNSTVDLLLKDVVDIAGISIRTSQATYKLITEIYKDKEILKVLKQDAKLAAGKIQIDTHVGFSEIGVLDQLAVLQSAFIARLNKNL